MNLDDDVYVTPTGRTCWGCAALNVKPIPMKGEDFICGETDLIIGRIRKIFDGCVIPRERVVGCYKPKSQEKVNEYVIYTYDEQDFEVEFSIANIDAFLETSENLGQLVTELEDRVAFQKDLKYCLENNKINCVDDTTKEDLSQKQIAYLETAIPSNLRVIRRVREYLGMNPEPDIKPSILTTEFRKMNAHLN